MDEITATNFTPTTHRDVYPAISPNRPALTQAGKTVLITGGGTGIGKVIARSFIPASAATVIIVGRRVGKLEEAVKELEQVTKDTKAPTRIVARSCDIAKSAESNSLWDNLATEGRAIDVLVLNAAAFSDAKSLFELGIYQVWYQMEFLINVSTASIHMLQHPIVAKRPAYNLTKASGTLSFQLLANTIKPDAIQIISFHPGVLYGEGWAAMGVTEDVLPFDNHNLPGGFAVWASSKEASFLHGDMFGLPGMLVSL